MDNQKKLVVAGATGLVGEAVIHKAIINAEYSEVMALVRRDVPSQFGEINQLVNYENLETLPLTGQEIVVCCLGTTIKTAGSKDAFHKVDFQYVINCAEHAKKAGVETFAVISSIGANSQSMSFYLKVKGLMENRLKELNFKHLLIFRPSLLLGNRKEFRLGEKIGTVILKAVTPLLIGKARKQRPVHVNQIANCLFAQIKDKKEGVIFVESTEIQKHSLDFK